MAVQCPKCGKQYDITLFQFGKKITCDCGEVVDADKPKIITKVTLKNGRPTMKGR
ncbi:MAG: hypothetical protein H8D67_00315 [Deltaproteobacteria bacterium]|nr:hypothetical protein [Deltaproteobacteria bacterium]